MASQPIYDFIDDFHAECPDHETAVSFLQDIDHDDFRLALDAYVRQQGGERLLGALEDARIRPAAIRELATIERKLGLQRPSQERDRFLMGVLDRQARLDHLLWQDNPTTHPGHSAESEGCAR